MQNVDDRGTFTQIQQCVRQVIADIESQDSTVGINTSTVARGAYTALLNGSPLPPLTIEWVSLEQLKQTARAELRGKHGHESNENDAYQGDMFSGHLQKFYPVRVKGEDDPIYKMRDFLSAEEIAQNVRALRKQANARVAHADALEAWAASRKTELEPA